MVNTKVKKAVKKTVKSSGSSPEKKSSKQKRIGQEKKISVKKTTSKGKQQKVKKATKNSAKKTFKKTTTKIAAQKKSSKNASDMTNLRANHDIIGPIRHISTLSRHALTQFSC